MQRDKQQGMEEKNWGNMQSCQTNCNFAAMQFPTKKILTKAEQTCLLLEQSQHSHLTTTKSTCTNNCAIHKKSSFKKPRHKSTRRTNTQKSSAPHLCFCCCLLPSSSTPGPEKKSRVPMCKKFCHFAIQPSSLQSDIFPISSNVPCLAIKAG